MHKRLLLCSALALAGCNSSPSNGDLENFLEPKFAACQNIKVIDIAKTNGYEEDGYYRVDFTYGIALKDVRQLQEIKTRGCAEFCVNGQSTAGASRPVRKHYEHQETRRT